MGHYDRENLYERLKENLSLTRFPSPMGPRSLLVMRQSTALAKEFAKPALADILLATGRALLARVTRKRNTQPLQ